MKTALILIAAGLALVTIVVLIIEAAARVNDSGEDIND